MAFHFTSVPRCERHCQQATSLLGSGESVHPRNPTLDLKTDYLSDRYHVKSASSPWTCHGVTMADFRRKGDDRLSLGVSALEASIGATCATSSTNGQPS